MKQINEMQNIYRRKASWCAKFERNKFIGSKYFADSKFGGSESLSLAAAKLWRDEMDIKYKAIDFVSFTKVKRKNTTCSGTVGVHLVYATREKIKPVSWAAVFKKKTVRFGISTYGEDEALRLALEQREKFIEEYVKSNGGMAVPVHYRSAYKSRIRQEDMTEVSKHVERIPRTAVVRKPSLNKSKYWCATLVCDDKKSYLYFSIEKLGNEKAYKMAEEAIRKNDLGRQR